VKTKQTPRYRWFFYSRNASGTPDTWGEQTDSPVLVTQGFFAKEKATKPIETIDAAAAEGEIQFVLIGAFSKEYLNDIQSGMFCWCPALNKVMEVIGSPVDYTGEYRRIVIYVVDNVFRAVDTGSLPLPA